MILLVDSECPDQTAQIPEDTFSHGVAHSDFTTLWANSADNKLMILFIFFFFFRKKALIFNANYNFHEILMLIFLET